LKPLLAAAVAACGLPTRRGRAGGRSWMLRLLQVEKVR
jgi:hypothetical protein